MKVLFPALVIFSIITLPFMIQTYLSKEPFTELYFSNPKNIPKEFDIGKEYNLSFTIVSHESRLINYSYFIKGIISEEGKMALSPEENKTILLSFKPEALAGNLTVLLSYFDSKSKEKEQSIYFFIK